MGPGNLKAGDKLLNAVVVIMVSWSKLTTLCVVIYGIIASKSQPRYWKQRALLLCELRIK